MAEIHVIQWAVVFLAATWITANWLLKRPESRWRHIVGGVISALLWIPVAATSNNVGVADGGETVAFGSDAVGTLALFMIIVCIAGIILGLFLWVERAVDDAGAVLPSEAQDRR